MVGRAHGATASLPQTRRLRLGSCGAPVAADVGVLNFERKRMAEMTPNRKKQEYPRYKRTDAPPQVALKHNRATYPAYLTALHEYRYLTTRHFQAITEKEKQVYEPLNRLYHAGYVERRYLTDRPIFSGSPQTIHVLTVAGLKALMADQMSADDRAVVQRRLDRSWHALEHELAVSNFQVLLHAGARDSGQARLRRFDADKEEPGLELRTTLASSDGKTRTSVSRWADAYFEIATNWGLFNYLLEIDLDRLAHPRKRARLIDRFRAYAQILKEERGQLADQLGIRKVPNDKRTALVVPAIQVLFVARTAAQRDGLITIANEQRPHIGRPNFWFLAIEDYEDMNPITAARRLFTEPLLRGLNNSPAHLVPRQ